MGIIMSNLTEIFKEFKEGLSVIADGNLQALTNDWRFIALQNAVYSNNVIENYTKSLVPSRRVYRGWLKNDLTKQYEMVYGLIVMECDLDRLYEDNQYIMERTPFYDADKNAIWTGDIIEVAGVKFVVAFLPDGRLNIAGNITTPKLGNIFENPEKIVE